MGISRRGGLANPIGSFRYPVCPGSSWGPSASAPDRTHEVKPLPIPVRTAKAGGVVRLAGGSDGKAQGGRGGGSATILPHDQGSATASVANSLEGYKTMKSIKSLPSFAALALCLSVSSMASAATITPVNSAFTAPGTISVSSPASLNLPVTCNITFKGKTAADGSYASIDSVTVSGSNTLCSVPQMTGLPWKLTVPAPPPARSMASASRFSPLPVARAPSTVPGATPPIPSAPAISRWQATARSTA